MADHLLVHNQDTPGNGPLLDTDKPASFRRRSKLTDIHGNLGRLNANSKAIDNTPDDEHADILRSANEGRSDHP